MTAFAFPAFLKQQQKGVGSRGRYSVISSGLLTAIDSVSGDLNPGGRAGGRRSRRSMEASLPLRDSLQAGQVF